jgi:putative addiction module component (TIGR02574 family)
VSQHIPIPPPGFDDLTVDEQLDYVQTLWQRIATHPEQIAVPDWHQRLIESRLEAHRVHPEAAVPWEQAQSAIAAKVKDFRSRRE